MRTSGSRRDFENMKHRRIRISEHSQFTADEIEVAGIIILFCYSSKKLCLQWGTKRRRSNIKGKETSVTHYSKRSPFAISASENNNQPEHDTMGMATPSPPTRRLSRTSHPNSKNAMAKNRHRKRAPKKKTHRELTEMAAELTLEHSRLIKEVEQWRTRIQDFKDCNAYIKSQLKLRLKQRQEQNMPYTSSCPSDTRQETETATSCDEFQRCDEQENSEIFSGSSALASAYDKSHGLRRAMYACSPQSSFGFEKDGAMPTQDTVCSGFLDMNVLDESLFNSNISNELRDQMPM